MKIYIYFFYQKGNNNLFLIYNKKSNVVIKINIYFFLMNCINQWQTIQNIYFFKLHLNFSYYGEKTKIDVYFASLKIINKNKNLFVSESNNLYSNNCIHNNYLIEKHF